MLRRLPPSRHRLGLVGARLRVFEGARPQSRWQHPECLSARGAMGFLASWRGIKNRGRGEWWESLMRLVAGWESYTRMLDRIIKNDLFGIQNRRRRQGRGVPGQEEADAFTRHFGSSVPSSIPDIGGCKAGALVER